MHSEGTFVKIVMIVLLFQGLGKPPKNITTDQLFQGHRPSRPVRSASPVVSLNVTFTNDCTPQGFGNVLDVPFPREARNN